MRCCVLTPETSRVLMIYYRYEDDGKPMVKPYKFSNQRLKDLGLEFTPLKKSVYEAVVSMQKKGHLPVIREQQRSYL
jgi:cinnamoyl-CoA reductase